MGGIGLSSFMKGMCHKLYFPFILFFVISQGQNYESSLASFSGTGSEDDSELEQENRLGVACKSALESKSNSILRGTQATEFVSGLVGKGSPAVELVKFQAEAAEHRIVDGGCPRSQIQTAVVAQLIYKTRQVQAAVWADEVQAPTGEVALSFAYGSFGTSCRVWQDKTIGALFARDIDVTQIRLPFPGHITDAIPSWKYNGVRLIVIDVHGDENVNLYLRVNCKQKSVTDFEDILISPNVPILEVRKTLALSQLSLLPGKARSFMVAKFDFNTTASLIV